MKIEKLSLPDILFVELDMYRDERGWFLEFWNPARMERLGLPHAFVQDNIAFSRRGVLRGLHFQSPHPQGKLVTVTDGSIYDVAVDVRPGSPTFGEWAGHTITPGCALYIPAGFAHGYQVESEGAHVLYKCTDHYHPECERLLAWNDPALAITWPIEDAIVSDRDQAAPSLAELARSAGADA